MNTKQYSRLIIHQVDLERPSPGGIDTCIRDFCRFAPDGEQIAVLGVAADCDHSRVGRWVSVQRAHREFSTEFMPVVGLDPANLARRVPHAIKVVVGVLRRIRTIPNSKNVQAHRADIALFCLIFFRRPLIYMIHTQQSGIASSGSDSVWRRMRRIHEFIERLVIRRAEQVIVFNPDYVEQVREANPIAISSPTWYNPTVFGPGNRRDSDEIRICWVGRMERPKDPELALRAFLALDQNTDSRVTLTMVGSGTERGNLIDIVSTLPEPIRARIFLEGRLPPSSVAAVLQDSSIFLMTSVPGYEGYPRVLVEAMACGLPCVVTEGSDTGSLVRDGITGYVVSRREPAELAEAILQATMIDPKNAIDAVSDLDAPTVVRSLIDYGKGGRR